MICRRFTSIIYFLLFFFVGINAFAQQLDKRIDIHLNVASLDEALLLLQQKADLSFAYESSNFSGINIQARNFNDEPVRAILQYLLSGTGYNFEERHNVVIIWSPLQENRQSNTGMKLDGTVEDYKSGDKLAGVVVSAPYVSAGTYTNNNGYFSLNLPGDTATIRVNYLGYKLQERLIDLKANPSLIIPMEVDNKDLGPVTITTLPDLALSAQTGKTQLPIRKGDVLPKLSGEVDLWNILKAYPGIREGHDPYGSLIVKGGTPDQNLVLLDGAVIYNPSHLFGMFSAINLNAIKSVDLYKSAFPARFGGRLSSVLDIAVKDGNPEKLHGNISAGTLASEITLEGPIVKNKTTFLIAARKSYQDLYLRLFTPKLKLNFHDLNFKVHHKFSEKDHLYFSGYYSKDNFELRNTFTNQYYQQYNSYLHLNTENYAGSLRWKHQFSDRLNLNTSVVVSGHQFESGINVGSNDSDNQFPISNAELSSIGILNLTTKFDLDYKLLNQHHIKTGGYYIAHTFQPSVNTLTQSFNSERSEYSQVISRITAGEYGMYIEDNWNIHPKIKTNMGLHLSGFNAEGKMYYSLQPRVNVVYQPSETWAVNASYVVMTQYMHRLSNNLTSLSADIWVPVTRNIKPQTSDQINLGISRYLFDGQVEFSVETYYKYMQNVAEFMIDQLTGLKPGSTWEDRVTSGYGKSYGVEVLVQKRSGRLSGWIGYTLSWANRTLPEINYGKTFRYKYDRRHSINIAAAYELTPSVEISAVFTFQSAAPVPMFMIKSYDTSISTIIHPTPSPSSEDLPNLKAYHRLDLGISFTKAINDKMTRTWNISINNVYNRGNTFFYVDSQDGELFGLTGNTLSPIMTSISYKLSF
jgi:hypothetical protein